MVSVLQNKNKAYRYLTLVLLFAILLYLFLPITMVVGSELGGYVSEKLIGGSVNSQLVIGTSAFDRSLLDVIKSRVELIPSAIIAANYNLNYMIPLIMTGMVIIVLLSFMAKSEEITIMSIFIAAIAIYVFWAFLPGIQDLIYSLLGS
jgi:positive regulator of sigma E activity